jgi:hypothetical protein
MLNVLENLFCKDMWHIVVSSKLLAEVGLSGARFTSETNLERFQTPLLAKFVLNELNIRVKTCFTVPGKVNITCWLGAFFGFERLICNEQAARLCFYVK